jgi:hypothetical protein
MDPTADATPASSSAPPLPPGFSQPPLPPGFSQLAQQPAAQPGGPPPGFSAPTANPSGEKIYRMIGPDGKEQGIPYSKSKSLGRNEGYKFADDSEAKRFMAQYINDPDEQAKMANFAKDDPALNLFIGVARHAVRSVLGFGDIASGQPDSMSLFPGAKPAPTAPTALSKFAKEPDEGLEQNVGGYGTDLAALLYTQGRAEAGLTGEALLKLFPEVEGAAKFQMASKLAQIMEKHPIIGKALAAGLAQGGQTYVNTGGAAVPALEAGGIGLVGTAVAGALPAALRDALEKNLPAYEDVGGQRMEIPAELRQNKPTPNQVAGQAAITTAAQKTLGQHLAEVNESRAAAPAVTPAQGTQEPFHLGTQPEYARPGGEEGPWAEKRTPRFTYDPNIAAAHLEDLTKRVDSPEFQKLPAQQRQEILNERSNLQKQMVGYHQRAIANAAPGGRSFLDPVDIPKEVSRVGSYTEAAQRLETTAKDGYEMMNDVTGGKFNALRQANKDAWEAYIGASGADAQRAAAQKLDQSENDLRKMFADLRGVVDAKTLDGFDDAFRNAQGLARVANAVDSTFIGNASQSARSWEFRGFDGNKLMANLSKLQQRMGQGPLQRLIGKENLDTLFQVAELNRTQTSRTRFGAQIKPVVQYLISHHVGPIAAGGFLGSLSGIPHGWEAGAAAGWGTAALASSNVMQQIITNPKVSSVLLWALDKGAKPETYGPYIGAMIDRAITDKHNQDVQEGNQ